MSQEFGVIVLAAGSSLRLGKPKQLLLYRGKTLVEHAASAAVESGAVNVFVVVGASAKIVEEKLSGLPISIVRNEEWAEGMGSSIRRGVAAIKDEVSCVVITLCDMPHVTPKLLHDLAQHHFNTGSPIVASSYGGVIGAPCAFGSSQFPSLLALKGDSGARELIRSSKAPVESVTFYEGRFDIDTLEDFEALTSE